jgi:hypothetical protein
MLNSHLLLQKCITLATPFVQGKLLEGLTRFHRHFAYSKFLRKVRSLKGLPHFCKIKLPHNFVQVKLPEGLPDAPPIKASVHFQVLQSFGGFGPRPKRGSSLLKVQSLPGDIISSGKDLALRKLYKSSLAHIE